MWRQWFYHPLYLFYQSEEMKGDDEMKKVESEEERREREADEIMTDYDRHIHCLQCWLETPKDERMDCKECRGEEEEEEA